MSVFKINELTEFTIYNGFGDIVLNYKYPINKFNPDNIKKVIFNPPATIVIFKDGSKEVAKCGKGENFDPEIGFAMVMMNIMFGSRNKYKKFIKKYRE